MTAIKERLIGAITVMSESDAQKFWHIIQDEFAENSEVINNLEVVEPTEEEVRVIKAYENGDERYQPYMTHEQVKKELEIVE